MTRKENLKKPQRLGLDTDSPTWHHSQQVTAQLLDPGSPWGWTHGHAGPFLRRREMGNSDSSCSTGVYINNHPQPPRKRGGPVNKWADDQKI